MRERLHRSLANPLLTGSFLVSVGLTVGNIFNYLYHVSMGRMLTPAHYGVLTALISFMSIFGVFAATMTTVVAKFVSKYRVQDSSSDIAHLLRQLIRRIGLLVLVVVVLSQFIVAPIASFLHIEDGILINLTIVGILLAILVAINSGALQGLLKFKIMALFGASGSILRLVLALTLVYLGFGLRGAAVGFFLAYLIPYLLTFFPLGSYIFRKESRKQIQYGPLIKYSLPSFVALVGLSMLLSMDIILVKHFFTDTDAGRYSALSVIGRVIFFATSSISMVMFPIIAGKFEQGKDHTKTFLVSLLLVFGAGSFATLVYFIFPQALIQLFYNNPSYLVEMHNLGLMGLFFFIYSLVALFIQYYLSISRTKIVLTSVVASILQVILIWNFHISLRHVIISSITAEGLLLILLVGYYLVRVHNEK